MSIASLNLTPSVAQAKDIASKICYVKQIENYSGADLSSADNYTQTAFLMDMKLPQAWSVRKGVLWNGTTYNKGKDKEATLALKFASRMKEVLQGYAEAMEGNLYSFLIEMTEEPLAGKYQLLHCMGELIKVPDIDKMAEPEFEFQVGFAEAAISIDLTALQTADELENLAVTFPAATSITQAVNKPFGMLQIAWPS